MSNAEESSTSLLSLVLFSMGIAFVASFTVDHDSLGNTASAATLPPPQGLAASRFETPSMAPSAIVLNSLATYRVESERVKFYFVPGRADIAPGVSPALEAFVQELEPQERLQVTAYYEEQAGSSMPAALAQQRAQAVIGKFKIMGLDTAQIAVQTVALSDGPRVNGQNRRVEVNIVTP